MAHKLDDRPTPKSNEFSVLVSPLDSHQVFSNRLVRFEDIVGQKKLLFSRLPSPKAPREEHIIVVAKTI